jgi:hypothetical protein
VPWLVLIGLMALRVNRSFAALYALVPLMFVMALESFHGSLAVTSLNGNIQMLYQFVETTSFSVAVAWLLMPFLGSNKRFIAVAKAVPVIWLGAMLRAYMENLSGSFPQGEFLGILISVLLIGLMLPVVLMLSGWSCRRNYSRVRCMLWLVPWSVAGAALLITPVAAFSWIASNGPGFLEFLCVVGVATGLILANLLPFVLLSSLNEFHHTRFKQWLRLDSPTTAPVMPAERDIVSTQ